MQLIAANLVPRADLSRRGRLRHLFQSQHRAVEFLRRRLEFGRNGHVHMMKCVYHFYAPLGAHTHCILKCGFSIMPKTFPKGSFTVATLIPSPTSFTSS